MKQKFHLALLVISTLIVSYLVILQSRWLSVSLAQSSAFELKFVAIDRQNHMVDKSPTRVCIPNGAISRDQPTISLSIPGEAYTDAYYPMERVIVDPRLKPRIQGVNLIAPANLLRGETVEGDALNSKGAVFLIFGEAALFGVRISAEPNYPFTLKVVEMSQRDANGARLCVARYLCGRGTVTTKSGESVQLGKDDSVDKWLPQLSSNDPFNREAASQALGWLGQSETEKYKAVSGLINALDDKTMEVRRNAAESLGRIGDGRAVQPLNLLLTREQSEWVRSVARESLERIK